MLPNDESGQARVVRAWRCSLVLSHYSGVNLDSAGGTKNAVTHQMRCVHAKRDVGNESVECGEACCVSSRRSECMVTHEGVYDVEVVQSALGLRGVVKKK